jgi:serine O-acetyltransferase
MTAHYNSRKPSFSFNLLVLLIILDISSAWIFLQPSHHCLHRHHHSTVLRSREASSPDTNDGSETNGEDGQPVGTQGTYNLGTGKNFPVTGDDGDGSSPESEGLHWYAPEPVSKPKTKVPKIGDPIAAAAAVTNTETRRKLVENTEEGKILKAALWDEDHFDRDSTEGETFQKNDADDEDHDGPRKPALFYPDIDLSIPDSVYSSDTDVVWDLMRWDAFQEAQREPLLVSFLHSTILNHDTLESSLAFLLANRLASPAMISTQIQSLILEALAEDPSIGRKLRADIMAVRDRDPACTCLPDVFLYFKGFHALQTYRVASVLWRADKRVLAHFLQSQMSQIFQIDIHPNAILGSGIMLDHGTGIVIGETARVGHNCSILHHVTLGGSGKKGVDRHPKVGEGVLLGAGASVLGNIQIGDGCQVGAGTLVITDLPPHCVAVGVPAKIIGSFVDESEQPSIEMNQMMDSKIVTFQTDGI